MIRGTIEAQGASSASLAKASSVALIDEGEAHLHPRWKMRVVRGRREALPGVTFLMTTHDPLSLRGLSSGEIVVLRRYFREDSADLPSFVEQMENLAGGTHAADVADQITREVRATRPDDAVVHFFAACTNSLLFFLGQQHGGIAPVVIYEFDFDRRRDRGYHASILIA